MTMLLWLIIIVGDIMGIIKVFGGWKNRPKWLNIVVWICCIFLLLACFGMSM